MLPAHNNPRLNADDSERIINDVILMGLFSDECYYMIETDL